MKRLAVTGVLTALLITCSEAPEVHFTPSPRIVLAELFIENG